MRIISTIVMSILYEEKRYLPFVESTCTVRYFEQFQIKISYLASGQSIDLIFNFQNRTQFFLGSSMTRFDLLVLSRI